MSGMNLPTALFICGTEDCFLDDSVMMGVKWQMSGVQAIVKIFPGFVHAFLGFADAGAEEGLGIIGEILNETLGGFDLARKYTVAQINID